MIALLITLSIYSIPVVASGHWWFIQLGFSSLVYISLIYHFAKIRERTALIGIELINLACIFIFAYNYFLKLPENIVTANIYYIIQACFFLELIVIVGGIALGVSRRYTNHSSANNPWHPFDRRNNLLFEGSI